MADGWDAWGAEGVSPVQRELEQIASSASLSRSTTPQPAAPNGNVAESSTGWTANTPYTSLPPQQPPQRRSPIQSPTSAAPPSRQYPPQIPASPAPSASALTPHFTSRGKGEISIAGRASGSGNSQVGSINRPPSQNGSQRGTMDFNGYRGSSANGHSNAQAPTTSSTMNNGWSSSPSTAQETRNDARPSPSSHYSAQNGHASHQDYSGKQSSSREEVAPMQNGHAQSNGGGGGWEAEPSSTQSKPVEQNSGWGAAPSTSTSVPVQSNPAGNDNGWGAPSSKPANGFDNTPSYSNQDNGQPASGNAGGWGSSNPSNGGNNYFNGDGGYGAQSSSYGGYGNSGGHSNGGGGGGGGSRGCFNCGQDGHRSAECSEPRKNSSMACFNCGQDGHRSAECSEPRKNNSMTCYNCGETGHGSRDCSAPRKDSGGGGGGGGVCFNCGEAGHNSRDCTNPRAERKPEVTLDPPGFLKGAIIGSGCCHLKDLSTETGAYVSLHKPDPNGNPDYKVIAIFKKHNEGMDIVEHALKVLVGRIKEREGSWMPEGKALEMWMKVQGQGGNAMSGMSGQGGQGSYGQSQSQNGYGDARSTNSYGNAPPQSQCGSAPSQPSQPPQNSSSGVWGAPNATQSQPPISHQRQASAAASEAGFTYPASNHGGSAVGRNGSSRQEPALAQIAQAFAEQERGFETAQPAHDPPSISHGREKTSDSGFASSYAAPDSNGWYGPSSSNNNQNEQSMSPSREMNASARSFTPKANINGSAPSSQSNNGPSNGWEAAAPSSAPINGRDRAPSVISHRSNDRERGGPPQERRQGVAIQQSIRNTGGGGWETNEPALQPQQNGWEGGPSQSQTQQPPASSFNDRGHNGYASPPMSSVRQSNHTIRSSAGSERGGEGPAAAPAASGWNAGPSAPIPASSSTYNRQNDIEDMSSRFAQTSISDVRRREEASPAAAAPVASGWDMPASSSSDTISKAPASGWEEGPSSSSQQAAQPTISRYENAPSHTSSIQRAPAAQDHHAQSNGWSNGGGNHEAPRSSQTMNGSSGNGWEGNSSSPHRDQPNGHTNGYSSSPSASNGNTNGYARSSYAQDAPSAPAAAPPARSEVGSVRSGNGSINPGWAASARGPLPPQNAAFGGNANGLSMNGYSGSSSYGGGGNSYGGGVSYGGGGRNFSSGGGGGGYGGFGGSRRSGGNEIPLRNNRWGRPPSSSVSSNNGPSASNIPSVPGSGW